MRALLVILGFFVVGCAAFDRRTVDSTRRIARSERVELGGWPQAIRIQGDDRSNPVLLFVHGGPGLPEMPIAQLNSDLERDFTIVQWDQRGAGKSYRHGIPRESMRLEQFVNDTIELTSYLQRTLGKRRIYLVGFSWGTLVAALAAEREPQRFIAYVGISQIVNIPEAELVLYRDALAAAEARHLEKGIRQLRDIGPPAWATARKKTTVARWWKRLRPKVSHKITGARYAALALTSAAYTPVDLVRLVEGAAFSSASLRDEIRAADLRKLVRRFKVPVYFLMGRHDTVVSSEMLVRYFATLDAPRGKKIIWFDDADHAPHLEMPERYRAVMRQIRAETLSRSRGSLAPATAR
jgi:pimeloyl-ACP methyl ester carboxylesterase